MERSSQIALRFFQTAKALVALRQHRRAALVYSAVTKCRGTSSEVKANALFHAAIHLFASLSSSPSEIQNEDRIRTIGFLRKCNVLLMNCPGSFDQRMKVAALLDDIYTSFKDHHSAAKAIKAALDDVTRCSDAERSQVLRWWIYFRCRSITNASVGEDDNQYALTVALDSAQQSLNNREEIAAAAFHLVHCQLALSLPVSEGVDVIKALSDARQSLETASSAGHGDSDDFTLLVFCFYLLSTLAQIRRGDLHEAAKGNLPRLKNSYNQVRQILSRPSRKMWRWISPDVITAVTFSTIADVNRGLKKATDPWSMISSALKSVGIDTDDVDTLDLEMIDGPDLPPQASATLLVALLERAVRLKLASVQIREAKSLLRKAVLFAFPTASSRSELFRIENGESGDTVKVLPADLTCAQLMIKCSVLLLLAEYHSLRGLVSGAYICTELLRIIQSTATRFKDDSGRELVTDTWQMALSYLSLLEGDSRPGVITKELTTEANMYVRSKRAPSVDTRFGSRHVLATAWFTIGVFHMRKSDVIESRRALRVALTLMNEIAGSNDQVVANTMAIQSSMSLTHENISASVHGMITSAMKLASSVDDAITLIRAKRQYKKMITRMHRGPDEISAAEDGIRDTQNELNKRQKVASFKVLPPPL